MKGVLPLCIDPLVSWSLGVNVQVLYIVSFIYSK